MKLGYFLFPSPLPPIFRRGRRTTAVLAALCLAGIALIVTPALADDISYTIEGDLALTAGIDVVGLVGAHMEVDVTFAPADQTPVYTHAASGYYYTQYAVTSGTVTLTGTAGGVNDGTYALSYGGWIIRNQHTVGNDFIEFDGSAITLTGGDLYVSCEVFFPDADTPPTTPAPLFAYTTGDVDYLICASQAGAIPTDGNVYGFTSGASWGGPTAPVPVESVSWGRLKSGVH